MFKSILASLVIAFSVNSFAQVRLPSCKITNLQEAQKCMDKVASTYQDYEEPNEGVASTRKDLLVKVMKALGNDTAAAKVSKADFVGLMLEHGDEHHIYYFTMKKGTGVKAVELYDLNLVDLESMLEAELTVSDLFLGTKVGIYDVEEDIEEMIKNWKEEQN